MTNLKSTNKPFWSCLIKSVHDWYNYWLGFPDKHSYNKHSQNSIHIHTMFSFMVSIYHFYLFVCLFVFVSWFSNFSCKFFVPSNSALKPFLGSSTYHTDIFFCTATTTLRSSWFWSWCKFEYFLVRYNFYGWCIVRFKVFFFSF